MKLTKMVKDIIRLSPGIRSKLALKLSCSETAILHYLETDNDILLSDAALPVIRKETGLTIGEILEPEWIPSDLCILTGSIEIKIMLMPKNG